MAESEPITVAGARNANCFSQRSDGVGLGHQQGEGRLRRSFRVGTPECLRASRLEHGFVKGTLLPSEAYGHVFCARCSVPALLEVACSGRPERRGPLSQDRKPHKLLWSGVCGSCLLRGFEFTLHVCLIFRLGGNRGKNPGLRNRLHRPPLYEGLCVFVSVALCL